MEELLSVCVGLGLAAACGFRVFVPLLVVSIAAVSGNLTLAQPFQWMGTYPALITFGVATALEVGGYYIPWVDNLLDTVATPAAVVAGTVVSASMFTDISPFLKWTLAAIAGGGVAGLVQSGTVLTRAASTTTTGGFGNALVATGELGLSLLMAVMSVILPVLAVIAVAVIGIVMFVVIRKLTRRSRPVAAQAS